MEQRPMFTPHSNSTIQIVYFINKYLSIKETFMRHKMKKETELFRVEFTVFPFFVLVETYVRIYIL